MKKLNQILNIMMGSFFGVFVGTTISSYKAYLQIPELGMRSAPWYCYEPLSSFLLFLFVVVICVIIKVIIHKMNKK